jgi:hypothetical protein
MFTPISRESPSFLLDLIEQTSGNTGLQDAFVQKKVHLTFYHLTHRFDVESKWLERFLSLFTDGHTESSREGLSKEIPAAESNGSSDVNWRSLTRVRKL